MVGGGSSALVRTVEGLQRDGAVDVVIVGAGPVGLWLAAELRRGGAEVVVLEKRHAPTTYSRALTLHARTLEIFASRGVLDPWLTEGMQIPTAHFALLAARLELSSLDTDYPFALFLPQVRTEELLERHAIDIGVTVVRGAEVTRVTPEADRVRVTATMAGRPVEIDAPFVVGCDGRRSLVRDTAGIGYSGTDDTLTCVIGDVRLDESQFSAPVASTHTEYGSFYGVRIGPGRYRLIGIERATMHTSREQPVDFAEFRGTIARLIGTDFAMSDPTWLARVGSATFQADTYRRGRLLLAGDAAHVHFPMGGQGLNLGIQDATNLGWKLAAHLRSAASDSVLDTYEQERLPAGEAVIQDTLAQLAVVAAPGREGQALRQLMTTALAEPSLNHRLARAAAGLSVRYQTAGDGDHPLVGLRVPNLAVTDGTDIATLLRTGRFCLVGVPPEAVVGAVGPAAGEEFVVVGDPLPPGTGPWSDVAAVLVRPDGHLAWATEKGTPSPAAEAAAALRRWLALPPAAAR